MEHQDWSKVVIRGKPAQEKQRAAAATRPKVSAEAIRLAKLDNEDSPTRPKMLSSESRAELVRLRLAEGLTQAQVDQRCSFPAHTVNQLEGNKRAPTSKELSTLNRVLKCGLRLESSKS
jgi:DNA-binding transcriptional regulator YiaG